MFICLLMASSQSLWKFWRTTDVLLILGMVWKFYVCSEKRDDAATYAICLDMRFSFEGNCFVNEFVAASFEVNTRLWLWSCKCECESPWQWKRSALGLLNNHIWFGCWRVYTTHACKLQCPRKTPNCDWQGLFKI